ncbi:hypothetical protein [Chitinophaga cymbidii]|uniref:Uncharacterized protein n=1 Tax=Chitinophaga cymbidii TaxID=1096750 RepID=A0A512RDQ0_9BACT|nr:hypothetical protein [Chitinophaga cymbidii]GEP93831.1 hypothetical protein CCY01nite_00910 [Chitinophaga cymbidii]
MKLELFGIEEANRHFLTRYWRSIRLFLLFFIIIDIALLVKIGLGWGVIIVGGGFLLLVALYGLRMSVNVLYKGHLDEDNDIVEIETLHFNQIRKIQRNRKDVKVRVIQDATSRYIVDMIRIDVDRKTYFTQKQVAPWSRERIQQVKNLVKQGIL